MSPLNISSLKRCCSTCCQKPRWGKGDLEPSKQMQKGKHFSFLKRLLQGLGVRREERRVEFPLRLRDSCLSQSFPSWKFQYFRGDQCRGQGHLLLEISYLASAAQRALLGGQVRGEGDCRRWSQTWADAVSLQTLIVKHTEGQERVQWSKLLALYAINSDWDPNTRPWHHKTLSPMFSTRDQTQVHHVQGKFFKPYIISPALYFLMIWPVRLVFFSKYVFCSLLLQNVYSTM